MALPGSSATLAAGDVIATQTVNSKEYQVNMDALCDGHLIGSKPIFGALIPSQVHVAAANAVHWDFFNGDAALVVRMLSIRQIPNITTAVTGIVFDWLLERTTSVGTGGAAITPWAADTTDTLDADITCRSKPTGGAAASTDIFQYSISSEETNAATIQIASQGGLELIPPILLPVNHGRGLVLRPSQGLRCVQITNSLAGNTGWLALFSVDVP